MKNKRGITLIALIITIIVLLILAGVSISMVVGENGILNRATDASKKTNDAKAEEERQFAMAEAAMNFETTKYEDKNGNKVTIPAGFAVSGVEGENTVDDGLVIIDNSGNEFVWIPCAKEDVEKYENANTLSSKWSSYAYDKDVFEDCNNSLKAKTWSEQDEQINAGKNSIINYGGFYVARYEAGVPSNAKDFYVPSEENSNGARYVGNKNFNNNLKPVSKKGNQVWNFISEINAENVSKNMYANNSSVYSYLIDSNSWNYICEYIFNGREDIEDSRKWGNYYDNTTTQYDLIEGLYARHILGTEWPTGTYSYGKIPSSIVPKGVGNNKIELATGICNDFKCYNIYDMAGNVWEWTTEKASALNDDTTPKIVDYSNIRGGSFHNKDDDSQVVRSSGGFYTDMYLIHVGFRVVLYLK